MTRLGYAPPKREAVVTIRITKDQKAELVQRARKAKKNLSEYVIGVLEIGVKS